MLRLPERVLLPERFSIAATFVFRPARVRLAGTMTLPTKSVIWRVDHALLLSRMVMVGTLATFWLRVTRTIPSLMPELPFPESAKSTFRTPEKLLVPFRTSVPQFPLLNAADPEMLPFRLRMSPGLLIPTSHDWAGAHSDRAVDGDGMVRRHHVNATCAEGEQIRAADHDGLLCV